MNAIPKPGAVPADLEAFWMPFTANRQFKASPRLLVAAKDMHYTAHDGRQILDGILKPSGAATEDAADGQGDSAVRNAIGGLFGRKQKPAEDSAPQEDGAVEN